MKDERDKNIPYKIYLEESEMPKTWYNVRADMKNKPAPLLNPGTLKPMTGYFVKSLYSRNWIMNIVKLRFLRKYRIFTRCIVRRR